MTGDSAYGTVENTASIEKAGIRAPYMALKGAGQEHPFFGKDEFSPTIPDVTSTPARRASSCC